LSGRYRVLVLLRDGRTAQEAKAETAYALKGRAVDISGPLAIRDVRFFRGEEERTPVIPPTYRIGDELWARFDITGFKAGDKNHVRVSYGVAILNPAGKVLFSEPNAATEEDSPFYPKRYVSGVASLTVQPKTPPGEYTLLITATDEAGGATCEARGAFRIEPL
jgi:hypothetical protein